MLCISLTCRVTILGLVQEYDARRIADGYVLFCKFQFAGFLSYSKYCDVVCTLIARVEKLAGRVELEAPTIVPTRPLIVDERKLAFLSNGKDSDTVVQAIASVNVFAIMRYENLRAEVAPGVARWQR